VGWISRPPAVDLAGANTRPPGDLGDHRSRGQTLGNNRTLLLGAPPTPPFWAGDDLNPCERTVSTTSANTVACTDGAGRSSVVSLGHYFGSLFAGSVADCDERGMGRAVLGLVGKAEGMASLMRRTPVRTKVPIFDSLRRIVPQVRGPTECGRG
jgi:hypothetical protein